MSTADSGLGSPAHYLWVPIRSAIKGGLSEARPHRLRLLDTCRDHGPGTAWSKPDRQSGERAALCPGTAAGTAPESFPLAARRAVRAAPARTLAPPTCKIGRAERPRTSAVRVSGRERRSGPNRQSDLRFLRKPLRSNRNRGRYRLQQRLRNGL